MGTSSRLWMYADLPIPVSEIGDLSRYKLVACEDPVELLRELAPFIGSGVAVEDLKARVDRLLADFPEVSE